MMLEFTIKEEYSLTPQIIRSQLNFDSDQLKSIYFLSFLAVGEKRLIIHSRANPINYEEIDEEELVFDLSDSELILRNISSELGVIQAASSFVSDAWRMSQVQSYLLFTRRSSIAKAFPNFGRDDAVNIVIKNPLPQIKNTEGYSVNIRPNAWQRAIGEGSILPIPITDGTKTRYLCFLNVDIDNREAEWLLEPSPKHLRSKNKVFSFFNRSKADVTHESLLKVQMSEFKEGSKLEAAIQNVILKNKQIYIFTRGMHEELHRKGGHAYSVLAQIDCKGDVLSKPFFLDHTLHKDQKKRGHIGIFTSSTKYCILESIYAAADDWKGKQRLFDLETNLLEEIKLPRGYSSYQLVDHFGDDFWFQERPKPGNVFETKIVRCELN